MGRASDGPKPLHGDRRLPVAVDVLRYALTLVVDPDADHVTGSVGIALDLSAETSSITLHARGLEITTALARRGEQIRPLTWALGPGGGLSLACPRPLEVGRWSLRLTWRAPLGDVPEGLYRVRRGGRAYVFSQFQPLGARRAFPCLDEPGLKVPFEVTLIVPGGVEALGNTPVARVEQRPEGRAVVFDPTPPLPTYLVAVAVGPFDIVRAPDGPVPVRIVTTAGLGHLAGFTLEAAPRILAALVRRCGRPMPYAKLDLVGVPDFGPGAMENVGLVTFREQLLLLDPTAASAHDRLWVLLVVAHELAHMWFGNLVTMCWWDDLWLNEAFATVLEAQVVDDVAPGFDAVLAAVQATGIVADHDALATARSVRQPVVDGADVHNAFDGITYGKGAALLTMARGWLGEAAFERGVQRYLDAHAHACADTDDLLDALAAESGQPVGEVLGSFLDQPGVPIVEVRLEPDPPALVLEQRRFGDHRGHQSPRWSIPLTLRFGRGEAVERRTVVLDEATLRLPLPWAPEWVHPNTDERAYTRWRVPPALLAPLLADPARRLSPPEQVALPGHLWALLEIDAVPVEVLMDAYAALTALPHRLVVGSVLRGLRRLGRQVLRPADRHAFARWVGARLAPHIARVGLALRPDDGEHDRLLRPELLFAAAELAGDRAVIDAMVAEAPGLLDRFEEAGLDALQAALPVAAVGGDAALFDRLLAALPRAPTPGHRMIVIRALGGFTEPALLDRGFELALEGALRAQDVFTLLRPASSRRETRGQLMAWLDRRHRALAERIGGEMTAYLPTLFSGCSTRAERRVFVELFGAAERRPSGSARPVRQTLETIDRNRRLAARVGPGLAAWLARRVDAKP